MMASRLAKRLPYPTLLESGGDIRDPAMVARVINNAVAGNLNVIGDVMLAAGVTETVVRSPLISGQSFLAWQALDPEGAALIPSIWLKVRGVRQCTIGHAAPAADTWLELAVFG
jgi:hypothetical protein